MKNNIQLNSIKQGLWTDKELLLLRKKLDQLFQLPSDASYAQPIKVTNYILQRLALMAGLSRNIPRNLNAIKAVKLKNATYFETIFHNNEFYPLLTALLKLHYQQFEIDWKNTAEMSKIINYEMEEGARLLLETNQLEQLMRLENN